MGDRNYGWPSVAYRRYRDGIRPRFNAFQVSLPPPNPQQFCEAPSTVNEKRKKQRKSPPKGPTGSSVTNANSVIPLISFSPSQKKGDNNTSPPWPQSASYGQRCRSSSLIFSRFSITIIIITPFALILLSNSPRLSQFAFPVSLPHIGIDCLSIASTSLNNFPSHPVHSGSVGLYHTLLSVERKRESCWFHRSGTGEGSEVLKTGFDLNSSKQDSTRLDSENIVNLSSVTQEQKRAPDSYNHSHDHALGSHFQTSQPP